MKIDVSINEVLRVALLMEHGGVFIKLTSALLVDNFTWLQKYFKMEDGP